MIIKSDQNSSGINDKIWIGKAVVDATHLSDVANRNEIYSIAMITLFYGNVIELFVKKTRNISRGLENIHMDIMEVLIITTATYEKLIFMNGLRKIFDMTLIIEEKAKTESMPNKEELEYKIESVAQTLDSNIGFVINCDNKH